MSVKLTDKETSALAKKVQGKKQKERSAKRVELIKKTLPAAKAIAAKINALPEEALGYLYRNRLTAGGANASAISAFVVDQKLEDANDNDLRTIEADVTIAAHDCATMATLCKKLGI